MAKAGLYASARLCRSSALALLVALSAACDHDWSSYDPRLVDASSSVVGSGPTTGSGGTTSSGVASGGAGGGGAAGSGGQGGGGEGGLGGGGGSGGAGGITGHLYVLGGSDPSGAPLVDVLGAPIFADGTLDSWSVVGTLPAGVAYHTSAHTPSQLFLLGGETSNFTNEVFGATPGPTGVIPSFDPAPGLPSPLFRHSTALAVDRLYAIGGVTFAGKQTAVSLAHILSNGTLDGWVPVTPLPATRHRHASSTYNGFLYVLGGSTDDPVSYTNDVLVNTVASDGSLGEWITVTPFVETRFGHKSVAANGRVYVLGGVSGAGFMLADVQLATMAVDGTLSGWQTTSPFAGGRYSHGCVLFNNRIYVAGGLNEGTSLDDVQFATILPDGTLSPWTTTTPLPIGRRFLTIEAL